MNVVKEQKRHQKVRPHPSPCRLSLPYLARSTAADGRRFLEHLWAATAPTANLAGRVGVLVVLGVALYYGLSLPASVPDWEWLWGIPPAIVVGGGGYALACVLAKDPPDDEPTDEADPV